MVVGLFLGSKQVFVRCEDGGLMAVLSVANGGLPWQRNMPPQNHVPQAQYNAQDPYTYSQHQQTYPPAPEQHANTYAALFNPPAPQDASNDRGLFSSDSADSAAPDSKPSKSKRAFGFLKKQARNQLEKKKLELDTPRPEVMPNLLRDMARVIKLTGDMPTMKSSMLKREMRKEKGVQGRDQVVRKGREVRV